MKICRLALVLAAAFLVHLNAVPAECSDKVSGPLIQLSERNHDFGEVDEGALLEHTFKVFNRGDQPLHIDKVSPS
ncbi:MAG: DUF1573 domain-containing protein [Desulfobacterales bacterium]|nr:DUF1573 domain-containing protein [Desulfobacterales bacterium]